MYTYVHEILQYSIYSELTHNVHVKVISDIDGKLQLVIVHSKLIDTQQINRYTIFRWGHTDPVLPKVIVIK